ncbi:MAG: ABC transporter permease [Methanothrix sp.]|nr:ABC transporter permease [Methanothrix sp.]MCX8206852.1 ABC transporter permease [Methanothrix sp.]
MSSLLKRYDFIIKIDLIWLSNYVASFLLILILNFVLPRMMPGDPLHAIYGEEALIAMTPEMEAEIIKRFALDQPWHAQLLTYIIALLRGDLGYSYYYRTGVSDVILCFLPWTLLLTGLAFMISSCIGVILGIESGYRRGSKFDGFMLPIMMFLGGMPDFFIGIILLLLFGVTLGLAPLGGAMSPYAGHSGIDLVMDIAHHLMLPLITLVLVQLAPTYLLTRNAMLTTLRARFIMTAKATGLSEGDIRYKHAGRNSLLPVVTAIGIRVPNMITGALFLEIVFSYPGVGTLLNTALSARDYPLIQGVLLIVTVTVLTTNFLVDMTYTRLDPRVRYAR